MSLFGAKLDWQNQRLAFHSSTAVIPAVHRIDTNSANHVSANDTASVSVAAVHRDFKALPTCMKSGYYVPPRS